MRYFIALFFGSFILSTASAQNANPPVNVETLIANEGANVQMLVSKKTQSFPRLGFFSATSLTTDWDTDALADFMHQGALTFELTRGLDLMGGYHYVSVAGIHGSAGLMGTIAAKNALIVLVPRFDLSKNHSIEGFISAEYMPEINRNIKLYTRFQGLYNVLTKNGDHQRSYAWFRAGITVDDFTFGAGVNLDYYGPFKTNINNTGLFVAVNLF